MNVPPNHLQQDAVCLKVKHVEKAVCEYLRSQYVSNFSLQRRWDGGHCISRAQKASCKINCMSRTYSFLLRLYDVRSVCLAHSY